MRDLAVVSDSGRWAGATWQLCHSASTSSCSRCCPTTSWGRQKDQAVRIKASWVVLSVVVLSVGLLLVASLDDPYFTDGQRSDVPVRSVPPRTGVSAQPAAPAVTTPTPSPPSGSTAAGPPAKPATTVSERLAPPPALSAAAPSAPPPTSAPSPGAAVPSASLAPVASEQPSRLPAPTTASPSAPKSATPPTQTGAAPSSPQSPSVLPAEAEMSAADRREIQEALHRLDYYKGPVDGIFGPLTRAAIRRFQQQGIGTDATGYLTADQANRLVAPR
jgi:Putative peptidoglycan binding domain